MPAHTIIEQLVRCYTTKPDKDASDSAHEKVRVTHKANGATNRRTDSAERALTPEKTELERALDELLRPWGGWCIVFDTETLTGINQSARIGVCSLYGIAAKTRKRRYVCGNRTREELGVDTLSDRWLFYDPDLLTLGSLIFRVVGVNSARSWRRCRS